MTKFSTIALVFLLVIAPRIGISQTRADTPSASKSSGSPDPSTDPVFPLHASATMSVPSEMGGAFSTAKCDADGNLFIHKAALDRPLLSPVVKIDGEGKRVATFDPSAFSQLALDRADAFSPASDGGIYQIAQRGVTKPDIYVIHFASNGDASSPTHLDADFEVYTFAAFADGNFLVSGVKRDASNKNDRGKNFTAVFTADGRELAQLSFQKDGSQSAQVAGEKIVGEKTVEGKLIPPNKGEKILGHPPDEAVPSLDGADAEAGVDGYLYVMRRSAPAVVYVISATGKIMHTLKILAPRVTAKLMPGALHISGNQLAISFGSDEGIGEWIVVVDAQSGRKVATYSDAGDLGSTFACYSSNDGVFTFLKLGEGNSLQIVRASAQ
jgi:hypothetical protein